ncbi:hypothetical protein GGR53DRAFT_475956 [Hypoxylon sp. FL1150]|nr:hypothetical protein GGR53DRAFT_475956 [Hypoxylon sp. FL1150]
MHLGSYLFIITALAGLMVLGDPFNVDRCPFYHLSEVTDGSEVKTHELTFVAMCKSQGDDPKYQMSSLNFTDCINNNGAELTDADQHVPYPGPFSGSCIDCGIATTKTDGSGDHAWSVSLRCLCANETMPSDLNHTEITLDGIIDVQDTGYISCGNRDGKDTNAVSVSIPPDLLAGMASTSSSSSSTSTSTTTRSHSKASTVTTTVTAKPVTHSSKCPSPKHTTITETETETEKARAPKTKTKTKTITETETETKTKKKKKTKTETQTVTALQKITETALANVQVTLFTATVYTTPPPSLLISASLQTTVKAIFTTITVPVVPEEVPVVTAQPNVVIVNSGVPPPLAAVPVAEPPVFPAGTV